jgi:tetratricopeptide (TPR) repeat protein
MGPHLRALAAFGRHELALLTETPTEARLAEIRRDRDECLRYVPGRFRDDVAAAWNAVEGLCLVRMGRAREAATLLEKGLRSLEYNPALVVYLFHLGQAYEHLGERRLATAEYEKAAQAFPGTRLASEANARLRALGPAGGRGSLFRGMLPEAPAPAGPLALPERASTTSADDEPDPEEKTG